MAAITNWMAEARRLESSGDVQGAIGIYRKALLKQEETAGFADLSLHNGLGDLYLRAGRGVEALEAYQRAAEQCEEQQLYANAIALCKKILRNAPEHLPTYRRVARLSVLSGLEAKASLHYSTYRDGLLKEGRETEVLDCLREMIDAATGEEATVALVDALVGDGAPERTLQLLREVKLRREADGRGVVLVVRRIQELQVELEEPQAKHLEAAPSATHDETQAESSEAPASMTLVPGSAATRESQSRADAEEFSEQQSDTLEWLEEAAPPTADMPQLLAELQEILADTGAADRFVRALRVVERMLVLSPGNVELLSRRLHYAYIAGEEPSVVAAYLELGQSLDRDLTSFTLRALSSDAGDGRTTAAVSVEDLPGLAPGS